jgi:hypothetical protein
MFPYLLLPSRHRVSSFSPLGKMGGVEGESPGERAMMIKPVRDRQRL